MALLALSLGAAACSGSSDGADSGDDSATTSTTSAPRTVVEAAAYRVELSTFATAANVAGMSSTLAGRGPFTVFVPDNTAFAKLGNRRLGSLLAPAGKQELARILAYHVVGRRLLAKDLAAGDLETMGGTLTVERTGDAVTLVDANGNRARVVRTDITAPNGVVHVVDVVLTPPR